MNPTLEHILSSGTMVSPTGDVITLHSGVSRSQGEFLQRLVRDLQPKATLEVGMAFGISSLFICEALVGIQGEPHVIIDPMQHADRLWKGCGIKNLTDAGYINMIEFHEAPSHRALPLLESRGKTLDFAFIDGAHTFDYALVDFFLVDKLLKVGGIVAFDDLWMPALQRLARYILTNHAYSVYRKFPAPATQRSTVSTKRALLKKIARSSPVMEKLLKPGYSDPETDLALHVPGSTTGMCIAFKKEAADTRAWDHYKDF